VNGGLLGPLTAQGADFSLDGWTVYNQQVRLDGLSSVAGWPTPSDASDPFGAPSSDTSTLASGFNGSVSLGTANPSPGGGSYLTIGTNGITSSAGYAVIHGPYLVNDQPVEIPAGSTVQFDWRASGGGDAYDVFAYLVNVDTGGTIELLNSTGANAGVQTAWATQSVTVPSQGRYKFVFVSGTWDASGGRALGANLQVDSVRVNASAPPTFSVAELNQMDQSVTYLDTGAPVQTVSVHIEGVEIESDPLGNASSIAQNLAAKINSAVQAGTLSNLEARATPGGVEVLSTVPGTSFSLGGARVSGAAAVQVTLATVTDSSPGSSAITGIRRATSESDAAVTLYGTVRMIATPSLSTQLPSPRGALPFDQEPLVRAGTKPFSVSVGDRGFTESGNFVALGFQAGRFGGRSSEAMDPPRTGRLAFQVGTNSHQLITIDLADFGKKGAITGDITGDVDLNVEQRTARIHTRDDAKAVLRSLDEAMDEVSATRASLGAAMNRLQYAVNTLGSGSVNQAASRSQIQDADYAKASTDMAKAQIMQQAATAVLAQANMSQQTVMQLLQS
ncbi:MAG: hypothetical protein EBR88_06180, partial [Betaproteobacteria bacterium]|nr:hypothetical protein [Betaproteobacteria bacterium]